MGLIPNTFRFLFFYSLYWCLIRYPFWFTSSSHFLQVNFSNKIFMARSRFTWIWNLKFLVRTFSLWNSCRWVCIITHYLKAIYISYLIRTCWVWVFEYLWGLGVRCKDKGIDSCYSAPLYLKHLCLYWFCCYSDHIWLGHYIQYS